MMLSVLITARNTHQYINKCIASINSQKWGGELEIIVCDDASEPPLQIHDSNVKVIRNEERLGISKSFNKIAEMSKGEYIFFMGSDDYLSGNFFKFAYEKITDKLKPCEIVYTHVVIEDIKGKYYGEFVIYLPIFHRKYLVHWDWPIDKVGHDIIQRKRLLGLEYVCNPSNDYHYVRWVNNITNNHKEQQKNEQQKNKRSVQI
jgi:glycosyltransferase involved in cell wall biosynthesis